MNGIVALVATIGFACVGITPASADLITGSFAGVVTSSSDGTSKFGKGIGDNTILGMEVFGTFSYVSELAPGNQCSAGSGQACYYSSGGVNWLNVSATVNGVTLAIPNIAPTSQGVWNYDKNLAGYDSFAIYDEANLWEQTGDTILYAYAWASISFYDLLNEVVPGDQLPTSYFEWTPTSSGGGFGNMFSSGGRYVDGQWTDLHGVSFSWNLTKLTLGSQQIVEVPEPSTVLLFCAGLVALGVTARRRAVR